MHPLIILCMIALGVLSFQVPAPRLHQCRVKSLQANIQSDESIQQQQGHDHRRRCILSSLAFIISTSSQPRSSFAIDAFDSNSSPLFDLSQQVRKGAVRGAQVIDKIDGKWERFSDDFGLGEKRNIPKVDELNNVVSGGSKVGDGQNKLDEKFAAILLQECDSVSSYFCKSFIIKF